MRTEIREFQGEYRFLSNFYTSPIIVDGWEFKSVEAAFQAAKSLDPKEWVKIQGCETSGEAKRMGKQFALRRDWSDIKVDVMRQLVHLKFEIPSFRDRLLRTGDATLFEGNTWGDHFWGVNLRTGLGLNVLGSILMDERQVIMESI